MTLVVALHRVIVPFILFALFFNLSIINPTEINWSLEGDLGQHFVGWTAFRFDAWRWPVGFSQLIAYPEGAPLLSTDSNPLLSLLFKPFSQFLPHQFQFIGLWYFICIILSYNIVFNLLKFLDSQTLPAVAGTILIIASPFFFQRFNHDTLMAHWLILYALSTFLRGTSNRSAITQHSIIASLALLVHPYLLFMILPIVSTDVLRRVYWHRGSSNLVIRFLGISVAAIGIPLLLTGWALGVFSVEATEQAFGHYSMDPLAWFNPSTSSAFFKGWGVGPGQYEGFQYLGFGGLGAVVAASVFWLVGWAKPPATVCDSLIWILPASAFLFLFAISPVVTAFGQQIFSLYVSKSSLAGDLFSLFRSSGRMAWPVSYLVLITATTTLLSINSRAVSSLLLIGLAALQLLDLEPVAKRMKSVTAPKEKTFMALSSAKAWQRLVDASDRVYAAPKTTKRVLFELGLLAFPQQKPLNRFYFAQNLKTPSQKKS